MVFVLLDLEQAFLGGVVDLDVEGWAGLGDWDVLLCVACFGLEEVEGLTASGDLLVGWELECTVLGVGPVLLWSGGKVR